MRSLEEAWKPCNTKSANKHFKQIKRIFLLSKEIYVNSQYINAHKNVLTCTSTFIRIQSITWFAFTSVSTQRVFTKLFAIIVE